MTTGRLPERARQALIAASRIKNVRERAREIDRVTARIKRAYPEYYRHEEFRDEDQT